MAQRPHVYVHVRRPAPPGEPPNRYLGELNAELRCYWTPLTPWEDVEQVIRQAADEALEAARVQRLLWTEP